MAAKKQPMTTNEAVEQVYPLFLTWLKRIKGYKFADGIGQIKLWYEFLGEKFEKPIDKHDKV